ncbi:MAG: phosphoribosyltransferase [Moorellales bacterium]
MSPVLPLANRTEAGELLAARLAPHRRALVLAVPRGGVEVGAPIARALDGELDLLLTRKVSAPGDPELAVGAVAPDGTVTLNQALLKRLHPSPGALEAAVDAARRELDRRLKAYRKDRPLPAIAGRTVIVVDDGIATGFTLRAGLTWLKTLGPARLVLAVPVAPPEVWAELAPVADEAVCLATPEPFFAVGQFYLDFSPTGDDRVIQLLQENWQGQA